MIYTILLIFFLISMYVLFKKFKNVYDDSLEMEEVDKLLGKFVQAGCDTSELKSETVYISNMKNVCDVDNLIDKQLGKCD